LAVTSSVVLLSSCSIDINTTGGPDASTSPSVEREQLLSYLDRVAFVQQKLTTARKLTEKNAQVFNSGLPYRDSPQHGTWPYLDFSTKTGNAYSDRYIQIRTSLEAVRDELASMQPPTRLAKAHRGLVRYVKAWLANENMDYDALILEPGDWKMKDFLRINDRYGAALTLYNEWLLAIRAGARRLSVGLPRVLDRAQGY
jgi:hypothetical protein